MVIASMLTVLSLAIFILLAVRTSTKSIHMGIAICFICFSFGTLAMSLHYELGDYCEQQNIQKPVHRPIR